MSPSPRTESPEEEAASFAACEAIAAVLQLYAEGGRTGDPARLRQAFHADATIRGSYGGTPVDWSVDAFCEAVVKGGPAPGLQTQVTGIDIAGGAAMARLEARDWRGTRYSDFFLILHRDGAWRIAGKIFHSHSRA